MPTTCLTPELKNDLTTGDIIAPESSQGILTGDCIPAQVIQDDFGLPLNYARIGYENILTSSTATVDPDESLNVLTPSTYDKWRPDADATLTANGDESVCNYVGIAAHNLGTSGATVVISTVLNGVQTVIFSGQYDNDRAKFIRFNDAPCDGVTVQVTGGANVEIGVIFLGKELEMMRPLYAGHNPVYLSSTDKYSPQMSDGGQFLGKILIRQGYATQASFKHLTYEWYKENFQPFVESSKSRPYFWAWNLLEHPDDIVYGWTNANITPSLMGIRNWLSVDFAIEAHA